MKLPLISRKKTEQNKKKREKQTKIRISYPVYFPPHAPSGVYTKEYYENHLSQFESGYTIVEVKEDDVVYTINDNEYPGVLYVASFLAKTAKKRCNVDILILALMDTNEKEKKEFDVEYEEESKKWYKYRLDIYILNTKMPHNKHVNSVIRIEFDDDKELQEKLQIFYNTFKAIQSIMHIQKSTKICLSTNLSFELREKIIDYLHQYSDNIVLYSPLRLFLFTKPIRVAKYFIIAIAFALGISYYIFTIADAKRAEIIENKDNAVQEKITRILDRKEALEKKLNKLQENNQRLIDFISTNKNKKVYKGGSVQ